MTAVEAARGFIDYEIRALGSSDDRTAFDCGEVSVTTWFRHHAGRAQRTGGARTFVAVSGAALIGFYATLAVTMERDEVAEAFGVGRRRYPKPAVLIAQLGVDRRFHGSGIGRALLVHALGGAIGAADRIGIEVLLVDALSEQTAEFYRRHGFRSLAEHPLRLFMTVKSLRAAFAAAE